METLRLPSVPEATRAYPGEVMLDLGNLTVFDPRGPSPEALQADATAACLDHGRDVLQRLVNELFSLPVATEQGLVLGRVVELPPPSTRLPREKPLPKPRAPTKWEAYAKSKGIVKRKRSARVWDEEQGEWRGRHGYRRVGDPDDKPILDAKSWETTGSEDPFSKAASEKKSRVAAQEWRQAANQGRAAAAGGKGMPGLSARGAPLGVIKSAAIARQSTASKGKFDKPSELDHKKGSKRDKEGLPGKRRTFLPVTGKAGADGGERAAMAAMLRKVVTD